MGKINQQVFFKIKEKAQLLKQGRSKSLVIIQKLLSKKAAQ
ncbi:hypothetical protein SALWKB12_0450 [Snodgrassella communis]|uniref:Uncharacterized protein n=1 Tax=Snodgrassella communis TaxID=2946699 RepID=A0A836MT64_9NEIS|nr:hypothetical protein SALWKB12_0450 [Snodgrassella communis]KDN15883.1 hypothetical protein SALWKB29_0302 [Snodgrassella communis]